MLRKQSTSSPAAVQSACASAGGWWWGEDGTEATRGAHDVNWHVSEEVVLRLPQQLVLGHCPKALEVRANRLI